jgi:hypothetical protein
MFTHKSIRAIITVLVLYLGVSTVAVAQSDDHQPIFAPLTIGPAPSQTRLANGAPGPKYWQNRADYNIQAVLDTATHTVRGSMTFRYTNNSPDALPILWMQTELDPNETIQQFTQSVNGKFVSLTLENHNTETKVTLAQPIKTGTTAEFHIQWSFVILPGQGGGRMGRDGMRYQIAQWYPRVNVYDDVKGWNTEPYTTGAEFYLDYGDYNLSVTVPAGYIMAATGTLDNPKEVLTATEIARLKQALTADTVIHVITAAELANGSARPKHDGTLTWKWHAKNVRDMVWAAAPSFRWDATHWKGVLAQAFFPDSTAVSWDEAADMVRTSLQEYSELWFPYPYPQATVVQGPITGMEYPMIAWIPFFPGKPRLYYSITHEVGHNWFPMIVGSNERVHTWMDEGFNQFMNSFAEARRYPENGSQEARTSAYVRQIGQSMVSGRDTPLETGQVIGNSGAEYMKTAAVLEMLRRDVMGPELFDKGMRTYVQRWAYKHPTPMDFFRTMNDVAGKNLDWFWREWFLETPQFDQAIDSVAVTSSGNAEHVTVGYRNKQAGVMPLLVRFTFSDSTTKDFTYPADIWKSDAMYTASYDFSGKTVKQIQIDPERHFIDVGRTDNTWVAK